MSDGQNEKIEVFETPIFRKCLKKLSDQDVGVVEDEIDRVIENPELGEQKKGNLGYLRVHKFLLNKRQVLLGYSWIEEKLELHLLNVGPHENFYKQAKARRDSDLKIMG